MMLLLTFVLLTMQCISIIDSTKPRNLLSADSAQRRGISFEEAERQKRNWQKDEENALYVVNDSYLSKKLPADVVNTVLNHLKPDNDIKFILSEIRHLAIGSQVMFYGIEIDRDDCIEADTDRDAEEGLLSVNRLNERKYRVIHKTGQNIALQSTEDRRFRVEFRFEHHHDIQSIHLTQQGGQSQEINKGNGYFKLMRPQEPSRFNKCTNICEWNQWITAITSNICQAIGLLVIFAFFYCLFRFARSL